MHSNLLTTKIKSRKEKETSHQPVYCVRINTYLYEMKKVNRNNIFVKNRHIYTIYWVSMADLHDN